jgi:hypothetical protein
MSTPTMPGISASPASGFYPDLSGLKLPPQLVSSITQGYQLIYSLRDVVGQNQQAASRLTEYGTSAQRQQTNPQAVPDGALWFETNTGLVYQSRLDPQQTTRQWYQIPAGGGAPGPPGPQGPAGPAGPQGPPGSGATFNPQGHVVTGQRVPNSIYSNPNGVFMFVTVVFANGVQQGTQVLAEVSVGGSPQVVAMLATSTGTVYGEVFFPVPAGLLYYIDTGLTPTAWIEWY